MLHYEQLFGVGVNQQSDKGTLDVLKSYIKSETAGFRTRKKSYEEAVSDFRQLTRQFTRTDPVRLINLKEKGKLSVRQRINLLVDPDTAFLELSPLASFDQYNNNFPGAGIVTGIGTIKGRETVIVANDSTIKGGTYIAETIKKHLRAQEIALENNLPCVYLVDSGGIFLPEQSRVFADRNDFGRIFFNQAVMSARGIPQTAVVLGSCTAGGAYIPAMCEETIIVRNRGTIFLGGPPLVNAAIGEQVTSEELGGAEVHTMKSGVADYIANSDEHALHICRNIFESFKVPEKQKLNTIPVEEPLYDPSELYGILPQTVRDNPDPREIIARIADGSRFHEFKPDYGKTLVTGFAHISGYPAGIIANHGVMHSSSALKGTHFIELCNFRKIPLVFLQNITGFMVGKEAEHNGIAKEGAKMVHAVANATVPKFTIITGSSFGAGNYAMAGRAFNPKLLFMFPLSNIAVMGAEQAASVLVTLRKKKVSAGVNGEVDETEDIQAQREEIFARFNKESSPLYSTSRLWDDGIIDPVDMRKVLSLGISMSLNSKFTDPLNGIYRM